MLKRIINFFDDKTKSSSPSVTDGATYSLTANMISRDARKVVETLQNAGFDAYIVGGAVRDLLLGIKPKDFDVATNAELLSFSHGSFCSFCFVNLQMTAPAQWQ